jgi:hypothetical protein
MRPDASTTYNALGGRLGHAAEGVCQRVVAASRRAAPKDAAARALALRQDLPNLRHALHWHCTVAGLTLLPVVPGETRTVGSKF